MAKTRDDLEAVRSVTAALSDFSPEEQERILRWAREKLGLVPIPHLVSERSMAQQSRTPPASPELTLSAGSATDAPPARDLKTFVNAKNPKSDAQFAATVAYYYRFEAPPEQLKSEIDAPILQDACRLSGRPRLAKPLATLNNAKRDGLLDSGSEAGKFTVNTVGENLVAMTLPGQLDAPKRREGRLKIPAPAKKTSNKK